MHYGGGGGGIGYGGSGIGSGVGGGWTSRWDQKSECGFVGLSNQVRTPPIRPPTAL